MQQKFGNWSSTESAFEVENVVMESEEEAEEEDEEEDIVGAFKPISASCFLSIIDSEGPGSSSPSSSSVTWAICVISKFFELSFRDN